LRYIRHDRAPDPDWISRATAVAARLDAAPDHTARSKVIESEAELYRELATWLLAKSYGKCWFSEAKDLFSHWHVEHYRPKNKARDEDGQECPGYWWLAFEWTNLRICGAVGNIKKGTYFPLRSGCTRATADRRLIQDEEPVLLDPSDPRDPTLIDFDEEGSIRPSPVATSAWDRERVDISTKRYKLNFGPLEQARKEIWVECTDKMKEYEMAAHDYDQHRSAAGRFRANALIGDLQNMCEATAPLSRVARSCLLASGKPWALALVGSL
jgi:hypothetical protein